MYLRTYAIDVVTTTSGTTADAVAYTTRPLTGFLKKIKYVVGTTAISSTAELTITTTGGTAILSSLVVGGSQSWYPVATCCNTTNGALTTYQDIPIADERIKVAIKNALNAGQGGTYTITVDGAG